MATVALGAQIKLHFACTKHCTCTPDGNNYSALNSKKTSNYYRNYKKSGSTCETVQT